MYLKIVLDNEVHYIRCSTEVSIKRGDLSEVYGNEAGLHLMEPNSPRETVTLFPDLPIDAVGIQPRTLVTNGKVYLLDDSGKTVDVIQR